MDKLVLTIHLLISLNSFQFQFSASQGKTSPILRNLEKSRFRHKIFCLSVWKNKFCDVSLASRNGHKF